MKQLFSFFILLGALPTFAQKFPEVEALNRVILNHKDSIIYAYVLPVEDFKKVTAKDEYWYAWYAQHDIKITRGGFDGKLLNGKYVEYYATKDLKTKGLYKKGLKTGKWKCWYTNGELSEIALYKNGQRHGKVQLFSKEGALLRKEKYRKGVLKSKKVKAVKEKKGKAKKEDTLQEQKSTETKSKKRWLFFKRKESTVAPSEGPTKDKKVKKKKEKEPKVKVRRFFKLVPQPGKST